MQIKEYTDEIQLGVNEYKKLISNSKELSVRQHGLQQRQLKIVDNTRDLTGIKSTKNNSSPKMSFRYRVHPIFYSAEEIQQLYYKQDHQLQVYKAAKKQYGWREQRQNTIK
ncbi:Hypothetical_protein [Hexamita inflata]|uniref:Hypothetical_protein n=1 Tax=Hexamita inflata TaxID=28002 RepID=A0ABP1KGU2_9EUKA